MKARIKKLLQTRDLKIDYRNDYKAYRKLATAINASVVFENMPQLFDKTSDTEFDPHYTYQGPWVMRNLLKARPRKHIDVGSWTTYLGFFAALQPTEFVDIRPAKLQIPKLSVKKGSVLELPYRSRTVESLSCLHVVEHVGLGRYGDPLDPLGTDKAIAELARVIKPGGRLYLALPIGKEVTYYNAHRVTSPVRVLSLCGDLRLESFSAVKDNGDYIEKADPKKLRTQKYACGFYCFIRDKK